MTKLAPRMLTVLMLALGLSAATWSVRHFGLAKSMPEADASVAAPEQIQLWFTQAPQEGSVSIRLVDAGGSLVETGDPVRSTDDPKLMEAGITNTLGAGAYTVAWRGIGDDGHVVRDEFSFSVAAQQ